LGFSNVLRVEGKTAVTVYEIGLVVKVVFPMTYCLEGSNLNSLKSSGEIILRNKPGKVFCTETMS